jgi:pimeloyl-ACP methyl ester carboxylesterase
MLDPVFLATADTLAASPVERANEFGKLARRRRQVWASREEAREAWRDRELFRDWDPRVLEIYLREGMRDRSDGQVELKCPGEIEATIFETRDRLAALPAAEKLRAPALLVRASQGQFPRALYERVAAAAAHMQLTEVDAGHLLPMVEPDRIGELLLRYGTET